MPRKKKEPSMRWGPRALVLAEYGIPREQLAEWATTGIVRTAKFAAGTKQGRKVYCLDDVADALERMAVGKEPQIKRV